MKNISKIFLILAIVVSACENQDIEFPDFDYTTVYFAYQTPVRTVALGKDYTVDNSLDNEHKCKIMATLGGVYENKIDRVIQVAVDNSLCDNLYFLPDTLPVVPMPSEYYNLPADMQIVIPSGKLIGGIEVELTDVFFADTLALTKNYVIPMILESTSDVDSILQGEAIVDEPNRVNNTDYEGELLPKDYVLYAVKYKNPYHGAYLRKGEDVITGNGNPGLNTTITYNEKYTEDNSVCAAFSTSLYGVYIRLIAKDINNTEIPFKIILEFDNNGNCTVTGDPTASYTATGSGAYKENADSWGDKERDAIILNYTVDFGDATHEFTDTLVLRDRISALETFTTLLEE